MQMQVLQMVKKEAKLSQNANFLESSIYERNDLRYKIKPGDKFIIRQGDLIVSNYAIDCPRKKGLSEAWIRSINIGERIIDIFRDSHMILTTEDFKAIYHPEHGLVILPARNQIFSYYTIDSAID